MVKTGLAWHPKARPHSSAALYAINRQYLHKGLLRIKVKLPLKIRTEYSVVIGCNHVLSVAEEIKLSYECYSHIHCLYQLEPYNRWLGWPLASIFQLCLKFFHEGLCKCHWGLICSSIPHTHFSHTFPELSLKESTDQEQKYQRTTNMKV